MVIDLVTPLGTGEFKFSGSGGLRGSRNVNVATLPVRYADHNVSGETWGQIAAKKGFLEFVQVETWDFLLRHPHPQKRGPPSKRGFFSIAKGDNSGTASYLSTILARLFACVEFSGALWDL